MFLHQQEGEIEQSPPDRFVFDPANPAFAHTNNEQLFDPNGNAQRLKRKKPRTTLPSHTHSLALTRTHTHPSALSYQDLIVKPAPRFNLLLVTESIAALIYASQLAFVIADIVFDVSRRDDSGSLSPLLLLSLCVAQLCFCAVWCLVFFCVYQYTTFYTTTTNPRHYLTIHRHLRSFLVYSVLVFLCTVFFYLQQIHSNVDGDFSTRYSDACRSNPTQSNANCPSTQSLLFWTLIKAIIITFAFTESSNFHDSISHHRFPIILKLYPDHQSRIL